MRAVRSLLGSLLIWAGQALQRLAAGPAPDVHRVLHAALRRAQKEPPSRARSLRIMSLKRQLNETYGRLGRQ